MNPYIKTAQIYALLDPRDMRVRYVGSTLESVLDRLTQHLKRNSQYMAEWIAELEALHLSPIPALLETVYADKELIQRKKEAEARWSHHMLDIGCDLLNITDPVDGVWLRTTTSEKRRQTLREQQAA